MRNVKLTVSENLASLRKLNGYTQAELANKLNYSDKSISKWERGEALPDIEILVELCELYGVKLDYLVNKSSEDNFKFYAEKKSDNANKTVITSLGVSIVWILCTIIFVYSNLFLNKNAWTIFIWGVPLSMIVLAFFNKLWGKKVFSFWICSIFAWSFLTCIFLQFLSFNIWLVYLVGPPVQIAIILWANLKHDIK